MKKFFVLLVMVLATLPVLAQGYSHSVEVQAISDTEFDDDPAVAINYVWMKHFNDHFKWGMGVGALINDFDFDINPSAPIFTRLELDLRGRGSVRPFLTADLGYTVSFENDDLNTIFANPSLGFMFGRFYIAAGYYGSMATFEGAKWGNLLNARIGLRFGEK